MIETAPLGPATAGAGLAIPRVIKGGWQLHERAGELDRAAALADLERFAAAGLTTFETADIYRGVDALLALLRAGRAARNAGPVRIHGRLTLGTDTPTRGEIFGKLDWARVRLGGAVDLMQLASWRHDDASLRAAWGWLVEAAPGNARNLGLMNLDMARLEAVTRGLLAPLTVQAQLSLVDTRALRTLLPWARANEVALLAFGTLAGGLLSAQWLGRPDPGLEPSDAVPFHREYRLIIEAGGGWAAFQRLLTALCEIAARHGVDPGTVATRWVLDQPGVTAALVGASSAARIKDIQRLFALRLRSEEHATLSGLALPGPPGPVGAFERDPDGPMAKTIAARTT